jgi:hypothetical protein
MKTIDVGETRLTLLDALRLAREDNLVLRAADGEEFLLAQMDDFAQEVALVRGQPELMAFLEERFKAPGRLSAQELRQRLGLVGGDRA